MKIQFIDNRRPMMRKDTIPQALPEEQAVSSNAIKQTIQTIREVNKQELHSFIMLRNGALIWEEYFREGEAGRLHLLASVSKSFASTAIGLAQAQGMLSIDDKLYDYFPDYEIPADGKYNDEVTLRHLLMMGSGFENKEGEMFREHNLIKAALSQPVINKPGEVFDYYTLGTYLLSAVFSRACPEGMHSYLCRKLFGPMGFDASQWNTDSFNIPMGGFGLYLTAYDLARFGQLYLQGGVWEGQQLVPEDYINEASAKQISNANHASGNPDWMAGYGYQFWRNSFGGYRADGMYGQYGIILPDKEAVIAVNAFNRTKEDILEYIWEYVVKYL
jgi:CubicO group peptidase (beta-lactamase class C family)